MKIRYCSDLHLEFQENKSFLKRNPLAPGSDILLLAGDIMLLKSQEQHADFVNYCSDNFQVTYWLPGNHEYYYYDLADVTLPLFKKIKENFILLNNHAVNLPRIELIFSTLWSHIPEHKEFIVQKEISDFNFIKKNGNDFRPSDFNALHKTDVDFIKTSLAKPADKKRIVITHHVPTLANYPEKYRFSKINVAFAVELSDVIEKSNSDYWIYGHHHCNMPSFKIGKTTLMTNQVGYVAMEEYAGFEVGAEIEV